jgi:5-(carboxyamino)imidazole ribonucleotide mutase
MESVLILVGSESDRKISEKAEEALNGLGISFKTEVASAHRSPEKLERIISTSKAKVIIAIAGLSAHLPGVCASKTIRPVIGVPVEAKLGGLDALLSIVNMPPGIPVATVGIDNGKNAGLLAAAILAVSDSALAARLEEMRAQMGK